VKQIRGGQQPDGMVVVLGGCFSGVPPQGNASADLLYTFSDAADDTQMFWEAFPAEGGRSRTAYAFCYTDADPSRPSFTAMLEAYLRLLPRYQGVPLPQLTFKRVLFGGFPCYMRGSPLPPAFDRVLQIGDASAAQSPLSFGGFGSMLRHLPRLAEGLDDALRGDKLAQRDLSWLQPYQPALSVSWLFQRAMSIKPGQLRRQGSAGSATPGPRGGRLPRDHVNRLMRCNFAVLRTLGDFALRPFVQDAMQLGPLALTMLGMMLRDPIAIMWVTFQVGPRMILRWFTHFLALAAYTLLNVLLRPLLPVAKGYRFRRMLDALRWGSSGEYSYDAARGGGGGGGDARPAPAL
jgi:lycopene cyclase CruP